MTGEYLKGESTYALAEKYNCHRSTISQHLKKRGIIVSNKKMKTEADEEEVIRLYQSGLTSQEIAEKFGISDTTILQYLNKHGIQTRTRWDYV